MLISWRLLSEPRIASTSAAADPALLADVTYLSARATAGDDPAQHAIHARAAIVMGMAAIKAVTNDALGAMHALIAAPVPARAR